MAACTSIKEACSRKNLTQIKDDFKQDTGRALDALRLGHGGATFVSLPESDKAAFAQFFTAYANPKDAQASHGRF